MTTKSLGHQVRDLLNLEQTQLLKWPISTVRVKPRNTTTPTEQECNVTYGPLSFMMLGKRRKMFDARAKLTARQVADELLKQLQQREEYFAKKTADAAQATLEAAAIAAVEKELPTAVGTNLTARPAIDVLGIGALKVTGIKYDPTEPVFTVSGEFTVAGIKQLLAGTAFRLNLGP